MSRLDRRKPTRTPKRRFYLLCEGANTEPDYFRALAKLPGAATIEIKIRAAAGDPSNISKEADKIRRSMDWSNQFEKNDEIWVVFDRDDHEHFDQAVRTCKARNISVAYSNPCFELWLLLHFDCHNRPDDRHQIQRKYKVIDPTYSVSNGKRCDFTSLVSRIEIAENNASQLIEWREADGSVGGVPSTTVHLLTKKLRGVVN